MSDTPTIGASMVPVILGLSPWQTPVDAWARLTGRTPSQPETPAMLRGTLLEPGLREWYAAETRATVHRGPTLAERGWRVSDVIHARPDGWREVPEGARLVEIKSSRTWEGWEEGVPAHYLAQVLTQLAAEHPDGLRIVSADVVAYVVESTPRIYTVERDERRQGRLRERVERWHRDYVLADHEPPAQSDEERAALFALLAPTPEVLAPTDEDRALVAALADANARARAAKKDADAVKLALALRIGRAAGLDGLVLWSPVKGRQTIDAKRLKREFPEAFAACAKTGAASRRFRILTDSEPDEGEE